MYPPSQNDVMTGSKKSLTLTDGLSPPLNSDDIAGGDGGGFEIPNNVPAPNPEPQPLPEASAFNMNDNSADKVMRQVDSFSQSNPDVADNVLNHLSSMNAAEAPDDRNIVKNLPTDVKNELQSEEKSLAQDDASKKTLAEDQAQANQNLQNELSNIAAKESGESNSAVKQAQDFDATTEKAMNGASEKSPEKEGILIIWMNLHENKLYSSDRHYSSIYYMCIIRPKMIQILCIHT